jgi:hypothetical protein
MKNCPGAERNRHCRVRPSLERQEHKAPSTFFLEWRDVGGAFAGYTEDRWRNMPAWLEVLLDVLGFAGFISLAIFVKPAGKNKQPDPR